jgi:hypothetical protein
MIRIATCADIPELVEIRTEAGTRAERFYLRNGWLAKGHTARGEVILTKEL